MGEEFIKKMLLNPDWLNIRRCAWIKLCNNCQETVVSERLSLEMLPMLLCSKCKSVLIKNGIKAKKINGVRIKCIKCGEYFVPMKNIGKKLCKYCERNNKKVYI